MNGEGAPRRAPSHSTLDLFGEDTTDQPEPGAIPMCTAGDGPTLRLGADGRPWHSICEPRDVGLTDPPTSLEAATKARKGSNSLLAQAILAELRSRGTEGATDDELADVFPEAHPGSRVKRRTDLSRTGQVRDSGRRRPSRWGRDQIVWVAT